MLSCLCSSKPKVFNPLENTLLQQDLKVHNLKRKACYYETAYVISAIASAIILLGVLLYVAVNAPTWCIILTTALELLAIKLLFENVFPRFSKKALANTAAYQFEKSIQVLSKSIEKKDEAKKIEQQMGCQKKSAELEAFIAGKYKVSNSKNMLNPILARAEKYNQLALKKLEELKRTIFSKTKDGKTNPYQEQVRKQNDLTTNPKDLYTNVRAKTRSFEAMKNTLLNEYTKNRLNEVFTAYVYDNPVHSGDIDKVGYLAEDTHLMDYLLEGASDTQDTLFAFTPNHKVISRDLFNEKHKLEVMTALQAGIKTWGNKVSADELNSITIDDKKYTDVELEALKTIVSNFANQYAWEEGETISLEKFNTRIKQNYVELFCDPKLQGIIRRHVNAHYIQVFKEFDLTSLRAQIIKSLLASTGITLNGDHTHLKPTKDSKTLPDTLFSDEIKERCKVAIKDPTSPTINDILSNKAMSKIVDELETIYYTTK